MSKEKQMVSKKEFWEDDEWAMANYERLAREYPEKWVAIVNKQVVASGDGIDQVRNLAKEKTNRKQNIPVLYISQCYT
ncbi:MAG: DUF5678 domain-containing protein [bacterium]|nr:DUF5678 domain-containing protein [bacterium]